MNRTRHPVRGAVGGALIGFGVALLLLVYGKLALTSGWPVLAVTAGVGVLGALVGLYGPTRGRRDASAMTARER